MIVILKLLRILDIFATMFKELNALYVDELIPIKPSDGINAMLKDLDPYTLLSWRWYWGLPPATESVCANGKRVISITTKTLGRSKWRRSGKRHKRRRRWSVIERTGSKAFCAARQVVRSTRSVSAGIHFLNFRKRSQESIHGLKDEGQR
jgi:hypothetical protein